MISRWWWSWGFFGVVFHKKMVIQSQKVMCWDDTDGQDVESKYGHWGEWVGWVSKYDHTGCHGLQQVDGEGGNWTTLASYSSLQLDCGRDWLTGLPGWINKRTCALKAPITQFERTAMVSFAREGAVLPNNALHWLLSLVLSSSSKQLLLQVLTCQHPSSAHIARYD